MEALNDDKERVETRLLGVGWNKKDETFAVELKINEAATISKKTQLKTLGSTYE